jgi:nucleoside-diphosphate-sugar epimerase
LYIKARNTDASPCNNHFPDSRNISRVYTMATDSVILITGATGQQSSALIKRLALYSYCASTRITIHATTRDPSSPTAQALLAHASPTCAIKLLRADFNDPQTLTLATTNVTHAFLVFVPNLSNPALEHQHAESVLSALEHNSPTTLHRLVYSGSVASLRSPKTYATSTPPIHPAVTAIYAGKHAAAYSIRAFAQRHNLAYTLLAPGTFLTNFFAPAQKLLYPFLAPISSPLSTGDDHSANKSFDSRPQPRIITALDPFVALAWVDPADVASFAAEALMLHKLDRRYRLFYDRAELKVAGQKATMGQVVEVLNRALREEGKGSKKGSRGSGRPSGGKELSRQRRQEAETQAQQEAERDMGREEATPETSSTAGTEIGTATETEPTDVDMSPSTPPQQPLSGANETTQITLEHIDAANAAHSASTNLLLGSQVFQNINPWIHEVDLDVLRGGGIRLAGVEEFFMREENRRRLRGVVFGGVTGE